MNTINNAIKLTQSKTHLPPRNGVMQLIPVQSESLLRLIDEINGTG